MFDKRQTWLPRFDSSFCGVTGHPPVFTATPRVIYIYPYAETVYLKVSTIASFIAINTILLKSHIRAFTFVASSLGTAFQLIWTHYSGPLARTERAAEHMGKKIWLSMHPRNFCNHVTLRPFARPTARPSAPQPYQCKITLSTGFFVAN